MKVVGYEQEIAGQEVREDQLSHSKRNRKGVWRVPKIVILEKFEPLYEE